MLLVEIQIRDKPYEGRNKIIALKIEDFQSNNLISTLVGLFKKSLTQI